MLSTLISMGNDDEEDASSFLCWETERKRDVTELASAWRIHSYVTLWGGMAAGEGLSDVMEGMLYSPKTTVKGNLAGLCLYLAEKDACLN